MSKLKFSLIPKITLAFLFITFSILFTVSFFHAEKPEKKLLRQLSAEKVLFRIFRVFNYFFIPFFVVSFFLAPWLYCVEDKEDIDRDAEDRNLAFFVNKAFYIIDIGYITSSGLNFFFDDQNEREHKYTLFIFICSIIYFLMHSILNASFSMKFKKKCFPGICQWGYLKLIFTAPCFLFVPCNEEEHSQIKCDEDFPCCCTCCCGCCGVILYLTNVFCFYFGLIIYSPFWLIGKFFVYVCCCKCWCKKNYDVDSFKFTKASIMLIEEPESKEDKKIKEEINKIIPEEEQKKIEKKANNFFARIKKFFSKNS